MTKAQGGYPETQHLYRHALATLEPAPGAAHPHIMPCRDNYAALLEVICL